MRAANSWWLLCCTHRQTCIAQNCSSARPKKARAPSLPTTFRRNCLSLPPLLFSVSVSFRYSCFSFDLFAPLLFTTHYFCQGSFLLRPSRFVFALDFSSPPLAKVSSPPPTWLELFESIAVTNVAVINWNRLRNCERGVREGARRGERIEKGDDRTRERKRSAHR